MAPTRRRRPAGGPSATLVAYDVDPDGRVTRQYGERPDKAAAPRSSSLPLTRAARAALLPAGFPGSVTPDYASFQAWDAVQGLCSYVRGVPSSAAVLAGLGLGRDATTTAPGMRARWPWRAASSPPPPPPAQTPLSAITAFFWRDLASMAAGAALASVASLDAHAKQWRLAADALASTGLALDLAAGAAPPSWFFPLVCAAGVARSLCGVAGGATRAALTYHFSRGGGSGGGNAADVAAKEGTQEAAVTLAGMVLGLGLARGSVFAPRSAAAVWVALTALHLYANVRAVRSLRLTSLNRARADVVVGAWVDAWKARRKDARPLSPDAANAAEPLLPPPLAAGLAVLSRAAGVPAPPTQRVRLGAPLAAVAAAGGTTPTGVLAGEGGATADGRGRYWLAEGGGGNVVVAVASTATPADELTAFAHAAGVAAGLPSAEAAAAAEALIPALSAAGWDTGRVSLGGGGGRVVVV